MTNDPTPQSAPQDAAQTLRHQRQQFEIQYPPPIVDMLRPQEVLSLPSEALVVIAGGPCSTRNSNTVKKIPNDAAGMGFVVSRMPQLVDAKAGGWNRQLDYDCDGQVEYPEILASLIRGAQIAYQRGIPLDQVPVSDLQAADIKPIVRQLIGQEPLTCLVPSRTPVAPNQGQQPPER